MLTEFRSTDWVSLTFTGERHEMRFRIIGDEAASVGFRIVNGLEDADLDINPGYFVADMAAPEGVQRCADGIVLTIEALTVAQS